MAAACRHLHNSNVAPGNNAAFAVAAFAATQIPDIQGRVYRENLRGHTNNAIPCDPLLIAAPIGLRQLINIKHPCQRVGYELQEIGQPTLTEVLSEAPGFA